MIRATVWVTTVMQLRFRALLTLVVTAPWIPVVSQSAPLPAIPSRIVAPIDDTVRVSLPGNVHPLAAARFDQGVAPQSMPTGRLMLVLKRSGQQQQALEQYLGDVQNPGSAVYHRWLTPARYGASFGLSDSDLSTVESWLQGQGFKIENVPQARNVIAFSGSIEEVQSAFQTAIHTFLVNDETHWANVSDPQIPAALAPVVAGIGPLNDFHPRADIRGGTRGQYDPTTRMIEPITQPEFTAVNAGTGTPDLFVNPADAATIYDTPNANLNPNYTGSTWDGTGVSIGILGTSDLTLTDVANYRMAFLGETSSSVNLPTVIVDGNDPGVTATADEALLDNEIAGGLAPKAKIYFYTAADTGLSSGLMNAWYRALDDDAVSILNVSFSGCEAEQGTAGNEEILEAAEQAAAEGITVTVSAGDAGSAGCDNFETEMLAQDGLGVNGIASTPYTIAVGGTDFDGLSAAFATYVSSSSAGAPPYYRTASGYIPEEPWNNSTMANTTLAANVAYQNGAGGTDIVAGGGGASTVYSKPAFQSSLTPGDSARDVPDVALFAANGFHQAYWAFCSDSVTDGNTVETYTECQTSGGQLTSATTVGGVGGTSASAPAFAGMLALVEQKTGSRLGQADGILYQLAASNYAAVFHDLTTGDNSVPCVQGSPNCGGNRFITGYNAGTGYDLASGLGSVDVSAMVNDWGTVALAPTSIAFQIDGSTAPISVVHGKPLTFEVGVSPASATGVVGIIDTANEVAGGPQNDGQMAIALAGGSGSATYSGLPGGTYTVSASYPGDASHASSASAAISVTVSPESSTTTLLMQAANPSSGTSIASLSSVPYGSRVLLDAEIMGAAEGASTQGLATGTVTYSDNGATLGTASVGSDNLALYPAQANASTAFSAGSHSVTAKYSGDASYNASTSSAVAFTILPAATAISATAGSGTVGAGQPASVSFAVTTPANLGAFPTGTVHLSANGQSLGTVTALQASTVQAGSASTFQLSGTATIPASQLAAGTTNVITVSYSGDKNYSAASTSVSVAVVAGTEGFSLANSGNISAAPGSSENATLTLTPAGGFTGEVVFACVISGDPPIDCITQVATVTGAGPVSSMVTAEVGSGAAPGNYTATITAHDAATGALSATTTLTITVTGGGSPGIALANSGGLAFAAGATTGNAATITVSPSNGFSGQVNLTCSVTTTISNTTDAPGCLLPASVTLSGTGSATAILTVTTTAPTSASTIAPVFFAGGGAALAMVLFVGLPARRRAWQNLLTTALKTTLGVMAAVLVVSGIGCGSSSHPSTTSGTGSLSSGTTPGAYVVAITATDAATGTIKATTTLNVTVN